MKMYLNKTIAQVKSDFNDFFPGLTVAFYSTAHDAGAGSLDKEKINEDLALKDITSFSVNDYIEIDPEMSVEQLESSFQEKYNLSVQVFRKSKDLWLQTTVTDHWSLNRQNEHGIES